MHASFLVVLGQKAIIDQLDVLFSSAYPAGAENADSFSCLQLSGDVRRSDQPGTPLILPSTPQLGPAAIGAYI